MWRGHDIKRCTCSSFMRAPHVACISSTSMSALHVANGPQRNSQRANLATWRFKPYDKVITIFGDLKGPYIQSHSPHHNLCLSQKNAPEANKKRVKTDSACKTLALELPAGNLDPRP